MGGWWLPRQVSPIQKAASQVNDGGSEPVIKVIVNLPYFLSTRRFCAPKKRVRFAKPLVTDEWPDVPSQRIGGVNDTADLPTGPSEATSVVPALAKSFWDFVLAAPALSQKNWRLYLRICEGLLEGCGYSVQEAVESLRRVDHPDRAARERNIKQHPGRTVALGRFTH